MPETHKIGYLIPQFPGQTHIFFWRELRALEALGQDVAVFSTRKPPMGLIAHRWSDDAMARTCYLAQFGIGDILIGWLKLATTLPWRDLRRGGLAFARDLLVAAPAARRLARDCKARGISHVHVHSCGRAALIAALACKSGGPGYSLTLHGPLSDYGPGQSVKWRGAAFATVITDKLLGEVRAELAGDLPDRIIVRPMGVDTETFKRDTPYVPAESHVPIRLFSCARLNVVKGHQDLMHAVRILVDDGLDIQLEIAGEDDDGGSGFRKVLENEIASQQLSDHVRLLGAIDAETVRRKLLQAHLFVLASWHEPLGVAYMEAMSCGVPTIGTDAGGVPELITDGVDGLLVSPKSPDALAAEIRKVLADPDLARNLSEAGRARIVGGFRATLGAEVLHAEIARLHT